MNGLFLARLPLLAALCVAVAVLGWTAIADLRELRDLRERRDRRDRHDRPDRRREE